MATAKTKSSSPTSARFANGRDSTFSSAPSITSTITKVIAGNSVFSLGYTVITPADATASPTAAELLFAADGVTAKILDYDHNWDLPSSPLTVPFKVASPNWPE